MIQYKKGNLIEMFDNDDFDVQGHLCNCTVGMGAGYAYFLKKKYPQLEKNDKFSRSLHPEIKFGSAPYLIVNKDGNNVRHQYIFNLYSQYFPGSPNNNFIANTIKIKDNFETRSKMLSKSLIYMFNKCIEFRAYNIALPLIGSGLGADKILKGSMTDLEYFKKYIEPIVENALKDFSNIKLTIVYL